MREPVLESKAGILWWRSEGFWHWRNAVYHELTAEEVDASLDAVEARTGERLVPLLVDRSHEYSTSFGAWQRFADRAPSLISAVAYFAPTVAAAMASEQVREILVLRCDWPIMVFRRIEDAESWLIEQLDNPAPTGSPA